MSIFSLRRPLWEENGSVMKCPPCLQSSITITFQLGKGRGKLSSTLARLRFYPVCPTWNAGEKPGDLMPCLPQPNRWPWHISKSGSLLWSFLGKFQLFSCVVAQHSTKASPPAPLTARCRLSSQAGCALQYGWTCGETKQWPAWEGAGAALQDLRWDPPSFGTLLH